MLTAKQDEANAALAMHEQEFRSRQLQVQLSSPQGMKRSSTTIVNRVGGSRSPSVEANGKADPEVPTGERAARTVGLMNVPDTVNDARIRALVEPYGKLVKVILRPDHQGAIVEYADVHAAGKASLELEGQGIAPGRQLHVGTVPEMLKQSAERKNTRATHSDLSKEKNNTGSLAPPSAVRRPQQPGRGSGRRGGLGVKRGGASTQARNETTEGNGNGNGTTATTETAPPTEGGTTTTKKSNDDFRAMIQRSQPSQGQAE